MRRPDALAEWLILILGILALIGSIAITMIHPDRAVTTDSIEYIGLAQGIARDGQFVSATDRSQVELYRTPGYPLLLCVTRPWESSLRFRLTLLLHAVLIATSALFVGLAARSLASRHVKLVVGVFLLQPALLVHSLHVGTEAPFLLLLSLVPCLLLMRPEISRGRALWAGLALGVAVLVRPIGIVFLVGMVPGALFLARRKARRVPAVLFLVGALVVPAAWMVRNGVRGGSWAVSKTGMSFVSSVCGSRPASPEARSAGESVFDQQGTGEALRDVLGRAIADPAGLAKQMIYGAGAVVLGPGECAMRAHYLGESGSRSGSEPSPWIELSETRDGMEFTAHESPIYGPPGPAAWILIGWSWIATLVMYGLAGLGVLGAIRRHQYRILLCVAAALLLVLASAGYQANARFRVPAIPLLLIAAAGFGGRRAVLSAPAAGAPTRPPGIDYPPVNASR